MDGEIELFEPGDRFEQSLGPRSIPVRTYPAGKLQLGFDRNYRNKADQKIIDDISAILNTHPRYEEKRPLTLFQYCQSAVSFSLAILPLNFSEDSGLMDMRYSSES